MMTLAEVIFVSDDASGYKKIKDYGYGGGQRM